MPSVPRQAPRDPRMAAARTIRRRVAVMRVAGMGLPSYHETSGWPRSRPPARLMTIAPIPEILTELQAGRMIILVDDPGRENEGDLAMLAERVTPEAINFMVREGRGLVCMPLAPEICEQLELSPQTPSNTNKMGTGFTVSIEAAQGVTTGISARDRAHTIKVACRPDARPGDLARPGHVFPLRAREGGVLVRGGQTEGIVDLARLCGARAAGVIFEGMRDDGTMARIADPTA